MSLNNRSLHEGRGYNFMGYINHSHLFPAIFFMNVPEDIIVKSVDRAVCVASLEDARRMPFQYSVNSSIDMAEYLPS